MASTNQTTHYELSQYIGTDKPTYLVDYNGDMAKIDSGIYGAKSEADTNTTSIGTLSNLGTTEKTNLVGAINEVNTQTTANTTNIGTNTGNITTLNGKVGDLTNLNTTNKTNLVNAVNEVKGNVDNFNLSSFTSIDSQYISTNGGTISNPSITIAKNTDGSLAKIYGTISLTNLSGVTSFKITITNTGLSPSSEFTINNAGMIRLSKVLTISGTSFDVYTPAYFDITIKTNGNIEIERNTYGNTSCVLWLAPILYWIKDFGDTPIQP